MMCNQNIIQVLKPRSYNNITLLKELCEKAKALGYEVEVRESCCEVLIILTPHGIYKDDRAEVFIKQLIIK